MLSELDECVGLIRWEDSEDVVAAVDGGGMRAIAAAVVEEGWK